MKAVWSCAALSILLVACDAGQIDQPAVDATNTPAPLTGDRITPAPPPERTDYSLAIDPRTMSDIMRDGPLAENVSVVDRCVEDSLSAAEVESNCVGLLLSACPGLDGTTVDLIQCNGLEFDYWDARMATTYDKLIALLEAEDAELAEDGPYPVYLAQSVEQSQDRWVDYREAQCVYEASMFRGGSMGRVTGSSCMRVLTARRAVDLEIMLANHQVE